MPAENVKLYVKHEMVDSTLLLVLSGEGGKSDIVQIGSVHDNFAATIEIVREPDLAEKEMYLCFEGVEYPLYLGVNSVFRVPNSITNKGKQDMQVMFRQGDVVEFSNKVRLETRSSVLPVGETEPIPDMLQELYDGAAVSGEVAGYDLVYNSASGKRAFVITDALEVNTPVLTLRNRRIPSSCDLPQEFSQFSFSTTFSYLEIKADNLPEKLDRYHLLLRHSTNIATGKVVGGVTAATVNKMSIIYGSDHGEINAWAQLSDRLDLKGLITRCSGEKQSKWVSLLDSGSLVSSSATSSLNVIQAFKNSTTGSKYKISGNKSRGKGYSDSPHKSIGTVLDVVLVRDVDFKKGTCEVVASSNKVLLKVNPAFAFRDHANTNKFWEAHEEYPEISLPTGIADFRLI